MKCWIPRLFVPSTFLGNVQSNSLQKNLQMYLTVSQSQVNDNIKLHKESKVHRHPRELTISDQLRSSPRTIPFLPSARLLRTCDTDAGKTVRARVELLTASLYFNTVVVFEPTVSSDRE
jgi:hypothetical protein